MNSSFCVTFTGSVPVHIGSRLLVARDDVNGSTFPMPTFARRPSTRRSFFRWIFSRILWLDSKDSRYWNCNSTNSLHRFSCWKIRFKSQMITCSDFPSEAMLWIKELENVDPSEELKPLDQLLERIFKKLKIIQNSHFKKNVSLEEQNAQKEDRFPRGRQNRGYDLRLLSGDWRSGHSTGLR